MNSVYTGPWFNPYRALDGITVMHVDLGPDAAKEQKACSWLDAQEHARYARFWTDRARREFSLCRASLRMVICRLLHCRNRQLGFDILEHGKPFATIDKKPAPIAFNVSHSGVHGLIAIAQGGQIGIDVEERKPRIDIDGIAGLVFGPGERSDMSRVNEDEKLALFYRIWTIKEAIIKAIGSGFSLDPSGFEIDPGLRLGEPSGTFACPAHTETRWRIESLGSAEFAAALAHDT